MFLSRTKADLMIEVWERLDCESIGAKEIIAIEAAVKDRFGSSAVESPMVIARLLADEGAELRHAEIMKLYVERASDRPYDAALRNLLRLNDLDSAAGSLRTIEALRRKLAGQGDKEGLRLLREDVLQGKAEALEMSRKKGVAGPERAVNAEIAEWLALWLHSPETFEQWLVLRRRSPDYNAKFGAQ